MILAVVHDRAQRGVWWSLVLCAGFGCGLTRPLESAEVAQSTAAVGTAPANLVACQSRAPCTMTQLAAGWDHTAMVRSDGTIVAAGRHTGSGTTTPSNVFVPVVGLTGIVSVVAGQSQSLVLSSGGQVWGWGLNVSATLGDGTADYRDTPVQALGLTDVSAIASGKYTGLALKSDGSVWGWGEGRRGELGLGSTMFSASPVPTGFSSFTAIASGTVHSLALKSDGTVWVAGVDGSGLSSSTPTQVLGLSGVTAIAASNFFSYALKSDGTVWGWGYLVSSSGLIRAIQPVQVPGLSGVMAIATGSSHVLALSGDGRLWSFGSNGRGELGYSTFDSHQDLPTPVPGLQGVAAIAAGGLVSVALRTDGSLWVWGNNAIGQLGLGVGGGPSFAARQVPGLSAVRMVASGADRSLAIGDDGRVWSWGANTYGLLGDGTFEPRSTPGPAPWLTNALDVTSVSTHTMALMPDGGVVGWGQNAKGQLGDGTTTSRNTPGPVPVPGVVTAITSSSAPASYAVLSDGTLWTWGANSAGNLGNGTTQDQFSPVQVPGLPTVTAIAASARHALALLQNGSVWAWGQGTSGELGNGAMTSSLSPVQVSGLSGVIAIGAGSGFSLALKSDGTVWAFGGVLGNGTGGSSSLPVQVSGLSGVSAIGVGSDVAFAVKSDGTVWAWGTNTAGQLGVANGTAGVLGASYVPIQVPGLSDISAVSSANWTVLARKRDGTVWAWGSNSWGQLGLGFSDANPIPTLAPVRWNTDGCTTLPRCISGACVGEVCSGNGTCDAGACSCAAHVEGPFCDTCTPGFDGPRCDTCAPGAGTYPLCQVPPDAGALLDAGTDVDAGTSFDAGTDVDAGVPDSGAPDAGELDGGALEFDAGTTVVDTGPPEDSRRYKVGCGCSSTAPAEFLVSLWLIVVRFCRRPRLQHPRAIRAAGTPGVG
jgi:alpha-tubulin suppressor-like RCC1 family protein